MLTLQFVPYSEIYSLNADGKVRKLLNIVKSDKIVLMEGRLAPSEETYLIEKTMEQINRSFKGIEICTIYPEKRNKLMFEKIRDEFFKLLLGNRQGLTVIGPASIVKEIKKDPNKIELLTSMKRKRK